MVEREENRNMLAAFRNRGCPIIHVLRDKDETIRYLVNEVAKPSWGEEIRSVWTRRTPYYEQLSTHTITSLTASPPPSSPQFLMKHVETAFVRLLRSIFGLASSHVPVAAGPRPSPITGPSSGEYGGYGACESELGRAAKGPRTNFVALNFPDLRLVNPATIGVVTGGVDVIELRVDTLFDSTPEHLSSNSTTPPHLPSLHFVALNFGHLRRCSPLPILYTVRTTSQGGFYPDPYSPKSPPPLLAHYLALVELGFKLGAEYVDIEMRMPEEHIVRLLSLRGAATHAVSADHDRKGEWSWDSEEMIEKYQRAANLGFDIIKLVVTPTCFSHNIALLNFRITVAKLDQVAARPTLPLITINLGKLGQLSRFLNPVFTPVTHPLLPGVAAPGQLTYAQTQQALYLSGLILEKVFFVPSPNIATLFSHEASLLGLPYKFIFEPQLSKRDAEPDFGGAFLGRRSLPTSSIPLDDDLLPPARESGYADLLVPAATEPDSYDVLPTPLGYFKHTNVRVLALAEVITQNLSPINAVGTHTAALLVGLDTKDLKEVLEALSIVGARWVSLYQCQDGPSSTTSASSSTLPSPSTSQPQSRASTPHLPYPLHPPLHTTKVASFSSPWSRRPPTIIIAGAEAPNFPEMLFGSPTGGAAIDLGRGRLADAVERRGGWQSLGAKEVEAEVARQAFKALTGRRMVI